MHNSYESVFLGLYEGIFKDISVNLPFVSGLERDFDRVSRLVATRGLRSVTVDLPAYGKHFDACLDAGRLIPSNIPGFGCKGGSSHPFLGGLISRVFARDGVLREDYCPDSIFFLRQVLYAAKKPKFDCKESATYAAFSRYQAVEASLRPPTLDWANGYFDGDRVRDLNINDHGLSTGQAELFFELGITDHLADVVHRVADCVSSSLGWFDPTEWRPKHGPGAVADRLPVKGWKYNFPSWSARLESVFPAADMATVNYLTWLDKDVSGSGFVDIEVPSVVLPVPKSQKTPRLIAKEPVSTMWCQQAVWNFLENQVAKTPLVESIHFRDQSFNSAAALKASKTRSHWTVDLSDASDRVSLWLVERLFRRNLTLLAALQASRSMYCYVPTRDGYDLLRLKKFAPQGSASTFPLQTIVFTILAVASVLSVRGWEPNVVNIRRASKEVLVFGDDSIVPEDSGRQYVELLTYCGLSVNKSKTYHLGNFRESCGTEAFDGWDVTPAYLTQPMIKPNPESVTATVECSNNFYLKGLWHTAEAVLRTVPRYILNELPVVRTDVGASFGLVSHQGFMATPNKRWNPLLHRYEMRTFCPIGQDQRSHVGGSGHLLQYFTETPSAEILWTSGAGGRSRLSLKRRWVAAQGDYII